MTSHLLGLIIGGMNAAFWSSAAFLLVISIVWPFWKSFWGINIVMLELAIALALLPGILMHDFGLHVLSNSAVGWIEVVALWLVGIIVIWRGGLIITEQVKATRRQQEAAAATRQNEKTLMQRENNNNNEKKCQQ
jgi:hypothetical protein